MSRVHNLWIFLCRHLHDFFKSNQGPEDRVANVDDIVVSQKKSRGGNGWDALSVQKLCEAYLSVTYLYCDELSAWTGFMCKPCIFFFSDCGAPCATAGLRSYDL